MAKTANKSIFFVVTDYQGCGWYRCLVPGVELRKLGHEVILDDKCYMDYLDSDVIVISRPCKIEHLEAIRYAKSKGNLAVVDVDDNIWDVKPKNPAYGFWKDPKNVAQFDSCLKEADVVTTTNVQLANLLKNRNKNIFIVPNMLPDEYWTEIKRDYSKDVLKLGWAGGTSHFDDLNMVARAVKQVVEDNGNVELHLLGNFKTMGNPFDGFPSVHYDIVSLEEYPSVIRKFDIGFVPLEDNNFNKYKSDLKFIENAAAGIPTVASNVVVYSNTIKHNENGLLARNDKDWIKCLRRLVSDAGFREKLGKNAREYAERRMISKTIGLWEKAYSLNR